MVGKLFIISAPCGAGKSTLVTAVLDELQPEWPIEQVITYTTRAPRAGEEDGENYHFIDVHGFEQRIKQDFFLEWSNAYAAYYGSPRSIVQEMQEGRSFLLILDRAGAEQVIQQVPDAILIWLELSSMVQLKERLMRRATESPDHIERRLRRAYIEITLERNQPLYHHIIMNDDFGTAKLQLLTCILAELRGNTNRPKRARALRETSLI